MVIENFIFPYISLEEKYKKGGVGYGTVKKRLVELLHDYFRPFRAKREQLENNLDEVEKILLNGAAKADAVAQKTMERVRKAVGFRVRQ